MKELFATLGAVLLLGACATGTTTLQTGADDTAEATCLTEERVAYVEGDMNRPVHDCVLQKDLEEVGVY